MKVIERDADSSPKIVLATREEIEQAGYSIAGYDVGKLLGEIEGVLGISVYEKRKPGRVRKVQTRQGYTRL